MENYLKNIGLLIDYDFITDVEEEYILSNITPSVLKKTKSRNSIRRFGSDLPYKGNLISRTIPQYLDFLSNRLIEKQYVQKTPESITINEYQEGQEITAHIDSKNSGPVITILSLLSDATMVFSYKKEKQSLLLPSKSLIQMSGELRYNWTHAILPVNSLRYSIVFRCT